MAAVKFGPFLGLIPRVPATALPANAALVAENIDFSAGELRSIKGDFKLRDLALAAQSVFSEDGLRFYAWADDVDAVVSPLQAGQASDRLYYTTTTDFRVAPRSLASIVGAAPTASYRVGVPRPKAAPSVTVVHPPAPVIPTATVDAVPAATYDVRLAAAQAVINASNVVDTRTEARAYAYTFANIYNEEGPPSDPVVVDVKAVTVAGVTTYSTVTVKVTFDGNGEYVPISAARIYRTASAGTTADYYFALSVPAVAGTASVADAVKPGALNEMLASLDAYPPDPALRGLMNLGNGILAAWKGNEMWFSDAYRPWSWPPAYMKTFGNMIVGAIPHGTGALVTTVGRPAIISGISPDAMSQIPLDIPQAGVSKWAMLSLNGMVIYASNDGIVAVIGGQPDLKMSERYFTRDVWQKRYRAGLASMQFAHYDGKVVVFSKAGAFVPFMLDLDEAGGAMTELPNLVAKTALVLVTSDQMYTTNGIALNQFAGGVDQPLRWKSGDMVLPSPVVLAAAQVECTGAFVVKFYQNGVLGYTKAVTGGATTFRLPSQAIPGHAGLAPSDRWQVEIAGSGCFKWLKVASSLRELAKV